MFPGLCLKWGGMLRNSYFDSYFKPNKNKYYTYKKVNISFLDNKKCGADPCDNNQEYGGCRPCCVCMQKKCWAPGAFSGCRKWCRNHCSKPVEVTEKNMGNF